jgi:uncharacterized protein
MSVPPRLSIVTLGARDLPALRSFYRGLGWTEAPGGSDDWTAFQLGGAVLSLYPIEALTDEAAPSEPPPTEEAWNGISLSMNLDDREDVDAVFARAVAAGATPVTEPQDRFWGGRSGYVADPEGNRWEIAWAPDAEFDERGAVVTFWPTEKD